MNQPPIRKHDLWPHQCEAYSFARDRHATLIGSGMGTGKTATAIALVENWGSRHVLVICPSSVRRVWEREVARHSAQSAGVLVLDRGSVLKRTALAREAVQGSGRLYVVINYEAAWREPFKSFALSTLWSTVILDESHRVMRDGRISKFCENLRYTSGKRLCLSGTPLTQDPVSVWAQCRFLDRSVFGGDLEYFRLRYENRFAVGARKALAKFNELWVKTGNRALGSTGVFDRYLRGTINTDQYLERLGTLAFRADNPNMGLPPLMVDRRTFRLGKQARALHDHYRTGSEDYIETGRWPVAINSYSVTMRLQQVTSGWLPDREKKIIQFDHGKERCLQEILDEAGGDPVVVFCRFKHDLEIVRRVALRGGLRYGEISSKRQDGILADATMADVQVCGVQEQAGGVGVDLTRARIGVSYSLSWSRLLCEQKIKRLHRPPQSRPVVIYELVAEQSIDEEIYRALAARQAVVDQTWREHAIANPRSSSAP